MPEPRIDVESIPEEAFEKMGTTREEMRVRMKEMAEYDAGTPAVGAAAPDFEVARLTEDGARSGERFRLSGHRAASGVRPVALVFGSYT